MSVYGGKCHCGNIRLAFSTGIAPQEVEVRACQCSFCVKHGSRAVADPAGSLVVSIGDPSRLQSYRFGLRTAQYLLCRECGVYVAAATLEEEDQRGIVIVNALDDPALFSRQPVAVSYDSENRAQRLARRRERWMPIVVKED